MIKRNYAWTVGLVLFTVLMSVSTLFRPSGAEAQQQYPIMDKVADKIILKYQQSSCEQLQQKESQKAQPSPQEIKAIQFLHSDPQMRVAWHSSTKLHLRSPTNLFDCGMIP